MIQRRKTGGQAATQETPKTIRCAIYTRKSTEDGLEQEFNSLDAQRESAEAYIASQKHEGWVALPDRYDDGGYSGGSMERPALRRLLVEVEAGRVDCVVVYKVDRLSRSLLDFSRIMGTLDAHQVSFVSVTQQFNTTTSMGRLTLNILLSFAQFEREIISERTRDKMSAARRKGKWIGGTPLLGYDVDPNGGRLLVNEAEAGQVRAIFDLYLELQSLQETAQELNRRGWTAKRWTTRQGRERGGRPFDKAILSRLLSNVTYTGRVEFDGTIYEGEHPAIVDPAVWEKVQRLLRRNGRSGGSAVRNKTGALLRGILWCGACDCRMSHAWTQKNGRRYRYYVCGHAQKNGWQTCPTKSLPAREIESFVVDRIRRIGTDPDLLAQVTAQVQEQAKARERSLAEDRRQAERELRTIAEETRRLVGGEDGVDGGPSAATGRLVELQTRAAEVEARLAEIARQGAGQAAQGDPGADLAEALRQFDPIWECLTLPEQTRVIALLVERVVYDAEQETVQITFRPGGSEALLKEVPA